MRRLWILSFFLIPFGAAAQQAEALIFREKVYDFGEIDEQAGNADHEFIFTNNSGRPVKIISVQTSCGCTTPGWSMDVIQHGKTGFVKASFDPRGRPGYFNKSLTITTDLESNPTVLEIKGSIKHKMADESEGSMVAQGHLQFKSRSINFGKVYMNKPPVQKIFTIWNSGTVPIVISRIDKPSYLSVEAPATIAVGEKAELKIRYDGKAKNQFGFASDNIQLITDDSEQPVKSVSVFATLEEYYALPSGEEAAKAPVLLLKEPSIDLGRFRESALLERDVTLANTGKKDLLIKALQGNCACIKAEAVNKTVRPGDSTTVRISFKPQSRGGTQQKAVTVYTNDPRNPVQRINVQAFIDE
ncbi:MAG: DUF1573 domain-containing protein [Cyclobacteriaceae bacterium]|nr:DUF1573 domain-containing protein [Cyclobacteriaceae bacterium]